MYKRSISTTRIKKGKKIKEMDEVLVETPIDIFINSQPLVNIVCLPKDLQDLALGFLFSVGLIDSVNDVKDIVIDEQEQKVELTLDDSKLDLLKTLELTPVSRVIDTSCGIPSPWRTIIKNALITSNESLQNSEKLKVKAEIISNSIIKMQKETELFRATGGCHGAALFDREGTLIAIKEDIGRHNAIDKVIGDILQRKEHFNDKILTTTGRLTGDSVLKAIRANIPIIASLSAAIDSGIKLAQDYGMTLIGFVRGAGMNIYTHEQRIIL
ncbi:MAG: formate dehydrogenase accessory sulfurtransferase FdhD [Candidatus Hermodarchaeota archaeon]